MSLVVEILNELHNGVPEPLIISKYPWSALPFIDREQILAEIEANGSKSKELLRLVAGMILTNPNCDAWEEARILSLGIRHLGWKSHRKTQALNHLERIIDGLEQDYVSVKPQLRDQCIRYRAGYWELKGKLAIDEERLDDAITSYQQSYHLFQQCSDNKAAQKIQQQLRILEEIARNSGSLISTENIEIERTRLQKELADLAGRQKTKMIELEQLENSLKALQLQIDRQSAELDSKRQQAEQEVQSFREQSLKEIQQITNNLEREQNRYGEHLSSLKREVDALQKKINENNIVLEFLLALSKQTTAPLWVEIVKLSLEQGEIDDFTLQALSRLAVKFPEQAGSFLTEMVTRLPGNSLAQTSVMTQSVNAWMLKIHQAEQMLSKDPYAAAKLVVNAWQEFTNQV